MQVLFQSLSMLAVGREKKTGCCCSIGASPLPGGALVSLHRPSACEPRSCCHSSSWGSRLRNSSRIDPITRVLGSPPVAGGLRCAPFSGRLRVSNVCTYRQRGEVTAKGDAGTKNRLPTPYCYLVDKQFQVPCGAPMERAPGGGAQGNSWTCHTLGPEGSDVGSGHSLAPQQSCSSCVQGYLLVGSTARGRDTCERGVPGPS